MEDLKRRKDIIIQPSDKGGAIKVIKREWYKEKMKDQISEDHVIIGNNEKKTEEEIINKMIKSSLENYGEKRLRNKRMKYIKKESTVPKMKGLPKYTKKRYVIDQ